MADIILHHYPTSPFAEKARTALGFKKLAWKSVVIPNAMPKPDLIPLTGGYRKTPVMQIGADVYCDTTLILREIERRHPTPTYYPAGSGGVGLIDALAWGVDRTVFWPAVGAVMAEVGHMMPESFKKDRSEFSGRSFDADRLKAAGPVMREQTYALLSTYEAMLDDGRAFLLGQQPSLADMALWNPVWFIRARLSPTAPPLDRLPRLAAWAERMGAIGHGTPEKTEASAALDIARAATPDAPAGVDPRDVSGFPAGARVSVVPDDTGKVPVVGELVTLNRREVAIRRSDERVGEVVVHFPRTGYIVSPT